MKDNVGNSFRFLLFSQSCGAFNDNFFKTVLALLIISTASPDQSATLISLTGALLIIPFIVFSPLAGFLSDKFSKKKITVLTRVFEPCLILAGVIFLYQQNVYALLAVLFCFGIQSAIFSPSKYGIIAELVPHSTLSRANGYIELATFTAILLGTVVAGQIQAFPEKIFLLTAIILFTVSFCGLALSFFIRTTPSAKPTAKFELNGFKTFWNYFVEIRQNKALFLVLLASAWFWFVGALFQLSVFIYADEILAVSTYDTGLLISFLCLGIGIGSLFAGLISKGKVELGLVPIGTFGLALACLGLSLTSSFALSLFFFTLLGISGGIFIVPLNSYFQANSPAEKRGSYIATSNLISNIFILFASIILWFMHDICHFNAQVIYFSLAIFALIICFFTVRTLPGVLVRCVNWILANTLYRTKVAGLENLPEGGGLIVCNHISYADATLILAASGRPIRFLMYEPIYRIPGIHFFAKAMGAIPISESSSKEEIAKSLAIASEAIKNGELVCIFAEGELTRIGRTLKFKRGFETIMKDLDAPIIPAYLDRIWGSIFSYANGKFFFKAPKEIPYPVTLIFGKQLPSSSKRYQVRQAVTELGADVFKLRPSYQERLDYRFIRETKRHFHRKLVCDSSGLELRGFALFAAVLSLRGKLNPKVLAEKAGVILPPGVPGMTVNLALMLAKKVPVNLNYTASSEALDSAISQCQIREVITSKKFVEKLNLDLNQELKVIYVEDLFKTITVFNKLSASLVALLPTWILSRLLISRNATSADLATIIFSSGSSGEPKGVMLSHANIASNIEGLYQVFRVDHKDCLIGVLPFFHSFGFTVTLWLPLFSGMKVAYHFNPIDAATVGKLAKKHKGTLLLATPTFLNAYLRKCKPEQFQYLRAVIVGAEKLKQKLAEDFEDKFGVTPLEGYGCTELSPVTSINIPNFKNRHVSQRGTKLGKVGHALPNIAMRIVDPDTKEDLKPGEDGLVLVKGPNVMLGYLDKPELSQAVMHEDWYITGDIGNLDNDGFLKITDRLSRFSKIAGEMVPHVTVEEAILEALKTSEQVAVVTSVADDSKGEKLVVLHTQDIDPSEISKKLTEQGLPNLWIPKKENFFQIDEIPLLGSGKLDLKTIKNIAIQK